MSARALMPDASQVLAHERGRPLSRRRNRARPPAGCGPLRVAARPRDLHAGRPSPARPGGHQQQPSHPGRAGAGAAAARLAAARARRAGPAGGAAVSHVGGHWGGAAEWGVRRAGPTRARLWNPAGSDIRPHHVRAPPRFSSPAFLSPPFLFASFYSGGAGLFGPAFVACARCVFRRTHAALSAGDRLQRGLLPPRRRTAAAGGGRPAARQRRRP